MDLVDAQQLFPAELKEIYDALFARMLQLGDDIIEEFSKTQVSYGAARKFMWLTPVTRSQPLGAGSNGHRTARSLTELQPTCADPAALIARLVFQT